MKQYSSILILYSPTAMKGKIGEFLPTIKQRLSVRYTTVDCMTGSSSEDMEYLAERNASKYDIIVACGGDGTLHQIVNGVVKSGEKPLVGLLPFGTCNDVARSLHIPFELNKAIDCLLRLNTTKYDLMNDGSNYGVYTIAAGYLTDCSYSASSKVKKRVGRLAYVGSGIRSIFKFKALPITVVADGERFHDKFVYFMLVNGESTGGFKVNKGEHLYNERVKLVMIKRKNFFGSLFVFLRLFMFGIKNIRKSKLAIVRDVHSVEIENHANTPFTFDGEKHKFLKKKINVDTLVTFICG